MLLFAGLNDAASIAQLQAALVGLAQATGDQRVNPARFDGTLDDRTLVALSWGFRVAAGRMPQDATTIMVGNALAQAAPQSKALVTTAAAALTTSIRAATAAIKAQPVAPGGQLVPVNQATTTVVEPAWYETWWGLGLLGVAGVVGYFLIMQNERTHDREAA